MRILSPLARRRLSYHPQVPEILQDLAAVRFACKPSSKRPVEEVRRRLARISDLEGQVLERGEGGVRKMRVGILFSGGPAAGGHNVASGLFDAGAEVVGFLGGPMGLVRNQFEVIEDIAEYRNQGGFDLIGTGRDKIEMPEQLEGALKTALAHRLDGVVIVGGDDSNTNAAFLAEYFLSRGCETRVVGVPKTIDGDLRSEEIAISFGFDSACKTYAELIGNIGSDARSTRKYYHFIKLMGRSASHIALECAWMTRPNLTLIAEEKKSWQERVDEVVELIDRREKMGKRYGVILLPEGLAEHVPDAKGVVDPHGNIGVSQIETEARLIEDVRAKRKGKFDAQSHFFGYEGRSCLPTNFDANYCYALGRACWLAIRDGLTGVICAICHLHLPPSKWRVEAVPLARLMHIERRRGEEKAVIKKTLVDTNSEPFGRFLTSQKSWMVEDQYLSPGPIQFCGGEEMADSPPLVVK